MDKFKEKIQELNDMFDKDNHDNLMNHIHLPSKYPAKP